MFRSDFFSSRFPTYRIVIMLTLPISHVWLGPVCMPCSGLRESQSYAISSLFGPFNSARLGDVGIDSLGNSTISME